MLRFRVHILKFIIFIALHAYLNAHAAVIGSQQVIQPAALVQATPTLPSSLSSSSSNMPGIPSSTQLPNLKDPQLAAALQNLPAEQKAQLAETAKQYLQQQPQTTEPVVSAEPKQAPVKNKRDAAFEMLLNQALPMSPDQIKEMRRLFDIVEEAKFTTPKTPPYAHFFFYSN
jgi:hypothetical protein